jgi:hypothetical protein
MNLTNRPLQVWHYPQIPCAPFKVDVKNEHEAHKMINVLADQHAWLYGNKIIQDYSNSFEVIMHYDGQWVPYYNHEENMDWDDFQSVYEIELEQA